jgi:poly(glycerol-phosphate) alpha-glucosyltransferase
MNKEIEGLEKKEFNNGNVIRYYDGETYVHITVIKFLFF